MKTLRPAPFILVSSNHGTLIVNRNDYRLVDQGGYGVGFQLLNTASFDQQEVDFALVLLHYRRKYHGDDVVAVDCGANIGVHAVEWAKFMHGWGSIFAFEAQEKIFYALAGNLILNNCLNSTAKHCAVGAACGMLDIPEPDYNIPSSYGSFELRKKDSNEFIGQTIDYSMTKKIEMISIDSLNLKRIDFIKIDVEGMEEEVLIGAKNVLERSKPILMIEKIKSDAKKLEDFLSEFDYVYFPMGINMLAVHTTDPVKNHLAIKNNVLSLS